MLARFFIDRPVFAWVISLVIMLAGALAIYTLPVEQYPRIAPPSVSITTTYPGASAKVAQDAVTQVIEQKMNGIDHLRYISSTSDGTGYSEIVLTFEAGTDPDIAQVQVQNKLQLAMPLLPAEVQQQGVKVAKATKGFLMVAAFVGDEGSGLTNTEIGDFIASKILDPISRVNGVGEALFFGSQHSMRVWLDPNKLNSYGLSTLDVTNAIKSQNAEVSAGQLGGAPAVSSQQLNATILVQTRLETPEQFGEILLRVNPDGSQVRLKDVSRITMGSENYNTFGRYNGRPAEGMALRLTSGANALDTTAAVKAKLEEMKPLFPPGLQVVYPYDTSPFVKLSIKEVVKTLIEAIILVFLVMYLFLQNFRATLIPTIAVPVVLLGTFAILQAAGFTINTLTMFGMVLAIGLLVDDAIVVVENVERVMSEEGLSPKEATKKSMGQITSALIGIALVLSAVFVPMAFFPGSVGAIYRQFSLTIVSAMVLSVVVALTLTPSLCATLLKPVHKGHTWSNKGFFGWFNRTFDLGRRHYRTTVRHMAYRIGRYMAIYLAIVVALGVMFVRLPSAFLPDEDQGLLFIQISLPAGATQERTLETIKQVENYFLEHEQETVRGLMVVSGFSFAGRGQNSAMAFINMRDWDERPGQNNSVFAVANRARAALGQVRDAMVVAFTPPSVIELGTANGFDFQLVDRAGVGHDTLMAARNQLLGMAQKNPAVMAVRPNGLDDTPQFRVRVDQEKASALGLSLADINTTLSTAWGSAYVNDFNDKGRVKRVYLQADAPFRMLPEHMDKWYVRNASGTMTPVSAFATGEWGYGSPRLERYNGVESRAIAGMSAPGRSSGEAMAAMEEMASQLPPGVGYEWTGLSYEERTAGAQAPALYAISILVVFLCLAALYESWSVPFSVMMVVPLGVLGAVAAALLFRLPDDVYFQVGLLVTIGLSAKNAILIVEFAKSLHDQGRSLIGSVIEAANLRLRPILMTSLAFILGVLPLATASGAGAGSQNAIGIGVMGGMLAATFLAILFVPVFFIAIMQKFGKGPKHTLDEAESTQ